MSKNDESLIFEAYQKIYESPIDPGDAWDEPDIAAKFDPGATERLLKYKMKEGDTGKVVDAIKRFLSEHENSHYPGSYKDFRSNIIDIIKDETGLGKANAGYASRVIQNELRRLNVIAVDKVRDEVTIKDVENDAVEVGVDKGLDKVTKIGGDHYTGEDAVIFRKKYTLNPDVEVESDVAVAAKELVIQNLSHIFTGREFLDIIRKEFSYELAKKIGTKFLQTDVLVPEEEQQSDKYGSKHSAVMDDQDDEDYNKAKDSEFDILMRNIRSGQSPTYGGYE